MKLPLFFKMGIHAIAQKAREINQNIDLLVVHAVKNKEKNLVNINRSQMLNHKRADDKTIFPKYSPSYASFKGFKDPNLKLTGDFQKDMFLETKGNEFYISSKDGKTLKLIMQYSEDIFGIAPSNKPKAQQISVKELSRIYYKKLLSA